MTKPSHYMFGLIVLFGAGAALLGDEILPLKGQLPFEGQKELARKEELFAKRQRAMGRMIDEGRGDFRPGHAKRPSQASSLAERSSSEPIKEGGVRVAAWHMSGKVRIETGEESSLAQLPWPVALQLVPIGKGAHQQQGTVTAACQPSGEYELDGLLPGLYRLCALPKLETESEISALPITMDLDLPRIDPASVRPGQQKRWPQNLVLPQPRRLFGRIFQGNKPSAGVRVAVHETGIFRGRAVSDENGRFEIPGVGSGPWRFALADAEGHDMEVDKVNAKDDFAQRRVEASVVVAP
ncbi:MAG: hypothetical protein CSA62_03065 [Planctomycetota bacterium]|nr:MAG: hypothetical protein CSA62_03065 [Planctomycetota bacterium]